LKLRRGIFLFFALVALIAHLPGRVEAASGCRPNPMANVWSPSRLKIISPCTTLQGTVRSTARQSDGDFHVEITLDSGGRIRGEIIPADQPGCTTGAPVRYGVCTGAAIATPKAGSHISFTGPKVKDTRTGGTEIHPIWQLTYK
jgi:hypothetical protein